MEIGRRSTAAARAMLLGAVAVLVVTGCMHSIMVDVRNDSGGEFYVRLHFDDGEVHVLRSLAGTDATVLNNQVGGLEATIELLRLDCSVVGSWRDSSGGMITIDAGGSATFGPIRDARSAAGMEEGGACGATQFPSAPPSPTVVPSGV